MYDTNSARPGLIKGLCRFKLYTRRGRCYTNVTFVTSLFCRVTWFTMPKEIPEWPSKTYVTLYTALQKDSTKLKLTTPESKAIEQQLPIYIESYFPDVFTDTGSLQGMKDMESRSLAEMADIKHKATGLSLVWKTEDTAAAGLERVQQNSRNCYATVATQLMIQMHRRSRVQIILSGLLTRLAIVCVWINVHRHRRPLRSPSAEVKVPTTDMFSLFCSNLLKLRSNSSNITQF